MWYEIRVNGKKYTDVYDTQEIIRVSCDLVNGSGVEPDDIEVVEHK